MEAPAAQSQVKQTKPPQPIAVTDDVVERIARGEPIAVYELLFRIPHPDLGFDETGATGRYRAKEGRSITYLPKLHLYRLEQLDAERKPRIVFVPREWATFKPL